MNRRGEEGRTLRQERRCPRTLSKVQVVVLVEISMVVAERCFIAGQVAGWGSGASRTEIKVGGGWMRIWPKATSKPSSAQLVASFNEKESSR